MVSKMSTLCVHSKYLEMFIKWMHVLLIVKIDYYTIIFKWCHGDLCPIASLSVYTERYAFYEVFFNSSSVNIFFFSHVI